MPTDGTNNVSPASPVTLRVTGGVLDPVTLTSSDGKPIAGTIARDGHSWTAVEPLDYGKTYTWSCDATNAAGERTPVRGSFSTATPTELVHSTLNIGDDETVGIAAPVILQFSVPIQDKAAVEKALSIHTSVPTEGSWAWLPDTAEGSRIHWRPKDYWAPGTSVTVTAQLFGLPYGRGSFGAEDVNLHFAVGRSQITRADASSHQLTVIRDDRQIAAYPASYGEDSDPDRTTHSGIHVVTEKNETEHMVSRQYHYDVIEHWAVRISNNGEFVHANPASAGAQGNANVTHGCINLSTTDAREYYNSALYGDPVEVTNTGVPLSSADGDLYDWTVLWTDWKSMSALH